jgi:hypothetical protein
MASMKTGIAKTLLTDRLSKLIPLKPSRIFEVKNYLMQESDQAILAESLKILTEMIEDFTFRNLYLPKKKQTVDIETVAVVETHPSVSISLS